jgi:outer membrane biosynthesis protein TonB
MSTGPSSNSAEAPSEPEPPFTGGRRHSWLTSRGRHPVTWAIAGVILLGSVGLALLQQQPDGRARAQSVYCGLVKCAVLRSVADSSTAAVGASRPAAALPSSDAPSSAPASTPTPPTTPPSTPAPSQPKPVAVSTSPAPAPSPKPTPTPKPPTPWAPSPSRWPWPPPWGWPWGGGGGWHHHPPRR